LKKLQCDIIAGLTVGLTVIPQSIAYAQIAGLNAQVQIFPAFSGSK
jgi:sodium-independent sulfate anion transporter 11